MSTAAVIAIAIGVVVVLGAIAFFTLSRRSDVRGTGALSAERSAGTGAPAGGEEPLLAAEGLSRRGGIEAFDLHVGRGEVLGLAGLLGSGRTEAARLLFGADRSDTGRVRVAGRDVTLRGPRRAIALGIAFCPEDRKTEGIFPEMSVLDNVALVVQRKLSRLGIVSRRAQARVAGEFIRRLGIVSGGNQQKLILARWLACGPRVLILDEPTRGIDVGAKAEVERLVAELAGEGVAILFISAELDEVVRRSNRVAVLRDRRLVGELTGEQINERTIMDTIAGEEAS